MNEMTTFQAVMIGIAPLVLLIGVATIFIGNNKNKNKDKDSGED